MDKHSIKKWLDLKSISPIYLKRGKHSVVYKSLDIMLPQAVFAEKLTIFVVHISLVCIVYCSSSNLIPLIFIKYACIKFYLNIISLHNTILAS